MTKSRNILAPRVKWTPAMDARLRRLYPTQSAAECAAALGVSLSAVHNRVTVLGLFKSPEWKAERARQRWAEGRHENSRARHFQPGQAPANKGRPQSEWMPAESRQRTRATQFKKGRPPREARNYQPIGSERMDTKRGVVIRKVSDDQSLYPAARWRPVHVLVWEAAHGPVPAGHICVFRPGKKTLDSARITADLLEVVTFAENMRRNSRHTRYPPELNALIQLKGALNRKINNRSRQA